jgi:hypothetical protein
MTFVVSYCEYVVFTEKTHQLMYICVYGILPIESNIEIQWQLDLCMKAWNE